MPALRDLIDLLCRSADAAGCPIPDSVLSTIERRIREEWPAQRVYIPSIASRIDPARISAIRAAAHKLPTGVVARQFGVSSSWVHRVVKK